MGLALRMGYLIAIPLVALALLGRFADSVFASSPLFFLIGILTAITCSTILVKGSGTFTTDETKAPDPFIPFILQKVWSTFC